MSIRVLGGAQTDFSRRWATTPAGLGEALAAATYAALDDAGLDAVDVEAAHIGNLAGELFTGQAHLGGMLAAAVPGLAGRPLMRHEAACASGSVALLAALAGLQAGHYDVALVVGVEVMRGVPASEAARNLGSAAWVGQEAVGAEFPWPSLFGRLAEVYADRYGLDHAHLGRIAELNHASARSNPLAQTRDWEMPAGSFGTDDVANPTVDGLLRKTDCGRITDGAAAVILATEAGAQRWAAARGRSLDTIPTIDGWGLRTDHLLLEHKLQRPDQDGYVFPHLRGAVVDALGRADTNLDAVDVVELHDCFTITEYVTLEHLGLAPPGQAWKVIEDGTIEAGGALPVNPSGGLLGAGHPVGATGVRMLHDVARQVAGRAGALQVGGARRGLTVNIGGSCTTAAAFVVSSGT